MSVKKTPQGTYRARVRDRNGRQITATFKLKGDADAWERDRLREREVGQLVGTSKLWKPHKTPAFSPNSDKWLPRSTQWV